MKKIISFIVVIMAVIGSIVWGISRSINVADENHQQSAQQPQKITEESELNGLQNKGGHKSLVVYYSYSGNTKQIAQHIHEFVGGDMFELHTVQSYPENYDDLVSQAKKELQDGYLPELQNRLTGITDYDVIYIGSPIWWGTDAPAVRTFLSQNNLSGKIVIPFVTHASAARNGGPGSGLKDIAMQAKGAKTLEGMHFYEDKVSDKQAVADWLIKIGMLEN